MGLAALNNLKFRNKKQEFSDSRLSSFTKSEIEKAPVNYKDYFDLQMKHKHVEKSRVTYMQKLILADMASIFFAITGLAYEMYSVRKCYKAKIFYDSNVIREPPDPNVEDSVRTEYLGDNNSNSTNAFLQMLSSFTTFMCVGSVYLSYKFEIKSLIQRNLAKNTGTIG